MVLQIADVESSESKRYFSSEPWDLFSAPRSKARLQTKFGGARGPVVGFLGTTDNGGPKDTCATPEPYKLLLPLS